VNWLALVMGLLKTTSAIVTYLNQKKLMEAGAAEAALAALERANEAIAKGRMARQSANADLDLHPERLRQSDGFKRPEE
jgi:hypothetical protein